MKSVKMRQLAHKQQTCSYGYILPNQIKIVFQHISNQICPTVHLVICSASNFLCFFHTMHCSCITLYENNTDNSWFLICYSFHRCFHANYMHNRWPYHIWGCITLSRYQTAECKSGDHLHILGSYVLANPITTAEKRHSLTANLTTASRINPLWHSPAYLFLFSNCRISDRRLFSCKFHNRNGSLWFHCLPKNESEWISC